ncbi:hypothetical protein DERF_013166 [Dermatophagoides farinae]|uniref:Uncharacterized protein n=1 Tax=Dermatophagoides farinae TaxID=6954 RepID=A0A922L072_DERFA|nr:hypothetical protein DERF_013166 [Dermatophagoides farinae]
MFNANGVPDTIVPSSTCTPRTIGSRLLNIQLAFSRSCAAILTPTDPYTTRNSSYGDLTRNSFNGCGTSNARICLYRGQVWLSLPIQLHPMNPIDNGYVWPLILPIPSPVCADVGTNDI